MNMKDIDSIRNEVVRFVESRVKELQMLEKRGKEPGAEEVACVCEQILEFWRTHLGAELTAITYFTIFKGLMDISLLSTDVRESF